MPERIGLFKDAAVLFQAVTILPFKRLHLLSISGSLALDLLESQGSDRRCHILIETSGDQASRHLFSYILRSHGLPCVTMCFALASLP